MPPHASLFTCGIAGWTIFDKLYILNGTVYVVSDHQDNVPDIETIISRGIFVEPGKEAEDNRLPTSDDIQIISSAQAHKLFGRGAHIIDGVSVRSLASFS